MRFAFYEICFCPVILMLFPGCPGCKCSRKFLHHIPLHRRKKRSNIGYTTDKPVHPVLYTFLPVFVNVTGNDYGLLSVTPGPVGVPKLLAVPGKVCTSQRKNIASSKRGCWEAKEPHGLSPAHIAVFLTYERKENTDVSSSGAKKAFRRAAGTLSSIVVYEHRAAPFSESRLYAGAGGSAKRQDHWRSRRS